MVPGINARVEDAVVHALRCDVGEGAAGGVEIACVLLAEFRQISRYGFVLVRRSSPQVTEASRAEIDSDFRLDVLGTADRGDIWARSGELRLEFSSVLSVVGETPVPYSRVAGREEDSLSPGTELSEEVAYLLCVGVGDFLLVLAVGDGDTIGDVFVIQLGQGEEEVKIWLVCVVVLGRRVAVWDEKSAATGAELGDWDRVAYGEDVLGVEIRFAGVVGGLLVIETTVEQHNGELVMMSDGAFNEMGSGLTFVPIAFLAYVCSKRTKSEYLAYSSKNEAKPTVLPVLLGALYLTLYRSNRQAGVIVLLQLAGAAALLAKTAFSASGMILEYEDSGFKLPNLVVGWMKLICSSTLSGTEYFFVRRIVWPSKSRYQLNLVSSISFAVSTFVWKRMYSPSSRIFVTLLSCNQLIAILEASSFGLRRLRSSCPE